MCTRYNSVYILYYTMLYYAILYYTIQCILLTECDMIFYYYIYYIIV